MIHSFSRHFPSLFSVSLLSIRRWPANGSFRAVGDSIARSSRRGRRETAEPQLKLTSGHPRLLCNTCFPISCFSLQQLLRPWHSSALEGPNEDSRAAHQVPRCTTKRPPAASLDRRMGTSCFHGHGVLDPIVPSHDPTLDADTERCTEINVRIQVCVVGKEDIARSR